MDDVQLVEFGEFAESSRSSTWGLIKVPFSWFKNGRCYLYIWNWKAFQQKKKSKHEWRANHAPFTSPTHVSNLPPSSNSIATAALMITSHILGLLSPSHFPASLNRCSLVNNAWCLLSSYMPTSACFTCHFQSCSTFCGRRRRRATATPRVN